MIIFILLFLLGAAFGNICPSGTLTIPQDKSCAQVQLYAVGYEQAQKICNKNGGELMSIHNAFANSQLVAFAEKGNITDSFYIGGDNRDGGMWEWLDGSEMDYRNWAPGQPEETNECITVKIEDRKWYAESCDQKIPFVCNIPQVRAACSGAWRLHEDNCYMLNKFPKETQWEDARASCVSKGGDLASIHTDSENDFLLRITDRTKHHPWIGLYWNGTYSWTDGSRFDFNNVVGTHAQKPTIYALVGYGDEAGFWNGYPIHADTSLSCLCKRYPDGVVMNSRPKIKYQLETGEKSQSD